MGNGREQAGRVHCRCALVRCAHACCRLEVLLRQYRQIATDLSRCAAGLLIAILASARGNHAVSECAWCASLGPVTARLCHPACARPWLPGPACTGALAGCIVPPNPMHCFSTGAGDSADQLGCRPGTSLHLPSTRRSAWRSRWACTRSPAGSAISARPRCRRPRGRHGTARWQTAAAMVRRMGAPARARRDARLAAFPLGSSNDTACACSAAADPG